MDINEQDIQYLIEYFSKTMFRAKHADQTAKEIMQKCIEIAKLDYFVSLLDNSSGDLCAHYPSQLIIMESEKNNSVELIRDTIYEGTDPQRLRDHIAKARSARCRTRFPVPVIFHRGKFVCRSATLSGGPEIYGRSGFDYFFAGDGTNNEQTEDDNDQNNCNNWVLCDQVRKEDIKLLKSLNVGTIVDFMVEKKKVKFGLNVTSSEKVDKEKRYSQFTILSLPYPGCEFFREFRDQNYSAENLYYNWSQTHVDAEIIVPQDNITERIAVKWKDYKTWNLPALTENYLQLLLRYAFDSSSGLLIHCISGWDRTPLFVSLLRICLWADGSIHKSLTPAQLLYFTIAYDWLLFGHNLQDRKNKGEDIFYFCFHFLKFVTGDEFSSQRCKGKTNNASNGSYRGDDYMQSEGSELDGADLIMYSQGSNHSLNSSWSSLSSKSQEIAPAQEMVPAQDLVPTFQPEEINLSSGLWLRDGSSYQRISDSPQAMVPLSVPAVAPAPIAPAPAAATSAAASAPIAVAPAPVAPAPAAANSAAASAPIAVTPAPNTPGSIHTVAGTPASLVSSGSDTSSTDSQRTIMAKIPMASSTSPVAVPARTSFRQRNESGSALSTGSWQYVSTTGSLRSTSGSTVSSSRSSGPEAGMLDSATTLTDGDTRSSKRKQSADHAQCVSSCAVRRERLDQIRTLFASCYCQSVGLNLKDGSENTGITNILGNIGKIISSQKS